MEKFSSTADLTDPGLSEQLRGWQGYYNHERPHGSLGNWAPWEVWWELANKAPLYEEVEAMYDQDKERFRVQDYREDLELQRVKGCL